MNVEAVSAILKEGSPVSTRIGSGSAWYRNIVYKSENNFVHLSLIDRYLENIVIVGTQISIKFFNEFFVYVFSGIIHNIYAGYPGYVIVQITDAEEIINTRLSPRYDIYLPANLKPEWDSIFFFSVITDISYGGMAFMCSHRFDHSEEVQVMAYLPLNQVFQTKGKVIRRNIKNGIIDYSMQFTEISEQSCGILSKYFARLDAENAALYQQFLLHSGRQ
ncbi:MAG: PilZ domain-containing protein [Ruminiclostridium sp.]|nr:PilZ domain-containing protein [Ruminiclostridium sp.]